MAAFTCEFTFNIAACRLSGELVVAGRREKFNAYAGSGGRAGSRIPGAVDPDIANNPFATRLKGSESGGKITRIGGPLPLGVYQLKLHERKQHWIRLEPEPGTSLNGRDGGFAIHPRGPNGSIGCIVPSDSHVVIRLCKVLQELKRQNAQAPRLQVIAEGSDMDRFLTTRTV